ncbi:MAG: hypothetical protein U9Q66_02200 [Patescibacteria group bacterium]|nr:hypothetical protein [Patescibacteria group bacterium]
MIDLYSRFLLIQENKFIDEYLEFRNSNDYIDVDYSSDSCKDLVCTNPKHNNSKRIMQGENSVMFIHSQTTPKNDKSYFVLTLVSLDENFAKKKNSETDFQELVDKYKLKLIHPILKQNNEENLVDALGSNYYELSFINSKLYNVSRIYTKDIYLINNQLVCSIYNIGDFIPIDRLIPNLSNNELFKKFIFQLGGLKGVIEIYELVDNEYIIRVLTEKVTLLNSTFLGVFTKDNKHYKVFRTTDVIGCIKELKNE